MGGGGPDDGIGTRRAGAPSSTAGPGTALAPWQVGVGQEWVEGEGGAPGRLLGSPLAVLPGLPGGSSLGGPGQKEQPARGSAFAITFANFPGGPVPSGRSRGWSCQHAFEARGVDCGDGETRATHKAPESTWGLGCRQTVLPLCTQVPAPNLDLVTRVERLHSKYQTKDVQCGVPGTEECDEEGGWRSEGHHGLLSSVVSCAGHWR